MRKSSVAAGEARESGNWRAGVLRHFQVGIQQGGSVPMRGSRAIRTALRSIHTVAFAALYGGHVFAVPSERLWPALVAVLVSGFAFLAFEVGRTPIWLVQIRGVATYCKLLLVVSVWFFWEFRIAILTLVILIGTVVSHMPGRYRYYSLLHRRIVTGGSEKG